MTRKLPRDSNQARGIAEYALEFVHSREPVAEDVRVQVERFHWDSIGCSIAALAIGANAPWVLRREALAAATDGRRPGSYLLGSQVPVPAEKAVAANSSAARELDSNGTNFGYNPRTGNQRGEFGHNDFYPVAVAAAQLAQADGQKLLRGMLALDEIRGRLAEVFGLKDYKIDHVVHGGIASAAVFGALMNASVDQIESAIGMLVAHYIPFRAIRAGHQLSDSKGASAAITAEAAVLCVQRSMNGFIGPADIFRNPQAIFCLFEPPQDRDCSPFDLELSTTGTDFAIMGMHFKLGLYEHQSAGAIQGTIDLLQRHPELRSDPARIQSIRITIYEPAFGIIGDPAKRDPRTRQSADHSMVYIIATLLRKAIESNTAGWTELMLVPADYDESALHHPLTRALMKKIDFRHGGQEFDQRYPDGIPTQIEFDHADLGLLDSGLVMYPEGHARNTSGNLERLLGAKFQRFVELGQGNADSLLESMSNLPAKTAEEIQDFYSQVPVGQ